MPNWCSNTLTVTGPEKDIRAFRKFANGPANPVYWGRSKFQTRIGHLRDLFKHLLHYERSELSLHKLYPIPWEVRRSNYNDSGYNWCVNNWGTKWQPDIHSVSMEPLCTLEGFSMLSYSFDSAWAPPIGAVKEGSKRWPQLIFELKYEEPGMCFYGTATVQNGVLDDFCEEMTRETHPDYFYDDGFDPIAPTLTLVSNAEEETINAAAN